MFTKRKTKQIYEMEFISEKEKNEEKNDLVTPHMHDTDSCGIPSFYCWNVAL